MSADARAVALRTAGRLTRRAREWWVIGGAVWLVCGVGPALLGLVDDWESGFPLLWLSVSGGLGMLGALLIQPHRWPWVFGSITLVWSFGWFYWSSRLLDVATQIVDRLVYARWIYPGTGMFGNFGHQLSVLLILSCFITTALLALVTRSWRVCVFSLIPAALHAIQWAAGPDGMWAVMLWHPLVVGALMVWAVSNRIHRFPAHACPSCGYDMRGLESGAKCPECGNEDPGAMGKPRACP